MDDSGMLWTFGSLVFVLLLVAAVLWPVTSIWRSDPPSRRSRSTATFLIAQCDLWKETSESYMSCAPPSLVSMGRVVALEKMLAEVE